MAKPSNYWLKRFETIEAASNAYGQEIYRQIEPAFDQAQRQIQAEIDSWVSRVAQNNQVSLTEARRLLSARELAEFKWDVKEFIKYGTDNALDPIWMKQLENASARYHISRLEALDIRTQQALEKAFGNQLDLVDEMARNVFTDTYYHSAFEIQKGFNVGWDIAKIDERKLDRLISKPWAADGRNFSDRIWQAKTSMVNELHNELVRTCILGKSPDEAIKSMTKFVDNRVGNAKTNAGRLVMTEQAFFSSAAQKECFNDLDVEEFEIVATLDSDTSDICRSLDGKHFPMKDYQPGVTAPPFHPWCRSTTVPWFEDNYGGERAARDEDGNTYYVPDNMTYSDWEKSFVDGGSKDGLKPVIDSDTMKVKTLDDCQTVEEVQDLMKSQDWFHQKTINGKVYDSNESLSLVGCDLEAAKQIYTSHEEVFDKFPQLKGKLNSITATDLKRGTYAQCHMGLGNGGINVNTKYFGNSTNLQASYLRDVSSGYHPIGTDWTSIVTHEIGHAIDDYLTNTLRAAGMVNSWKPKWVSASLRPQVTRAAGFKVNDIMQEVSIYATKDHFEFFAESFAEYMKSDSPREIATEFGKQLETILEGVK